MQATLWRIWLALHALRRKWGFVATANDWPIRALGRFVAVSPHPEARSPKE